jgi:hypothetical protein
MPIDLSNLSAEDIAAATAAVEPARRENVGKRRNGENDRRRSRLVRRR